MLCTLLHCRLEQLSHKLPKSRETNYSSKYSLFALLSTLSTYFSQAEKVWLVWLVWLGMDKC